MKRISPARRIGIVFLLALLGGLCVYIWMVGHLARDRSRIEEELANVLELIETSSMDPLMDSAYHEMAPDEFLAKVKARATLREHLATALDSPIIYWADWTDDGHHGAESIDAHEGRLGLTTFPWIASRSWDGRRALYRGRSFEGDRLLVFEGHVPNGYKKVYSIAFYERAFHEASSLKIHKDAQQGAAGQPATRPELKSEDSQQHQPKSEGRSR